MRDLSTARERPSAIASLRPIVEAVAAEAEADRQHHRTRKRARGDCSRGFFDDPDRFALAAMVAAQLAGAGSLLSCGGRRSDWSAARHAAALFAPGRRVHVDYSHRRIAGALAARAVFRVPSLHDAAARRLIRKNKALDGLPAAWVSVSGALLAQLNAPARSGARAYARCLLVRLGWRDVPPSTWTRLGRLLAFNEVSGLAGLLVNDGP